MGGTQVVIMRGVLDDAYLPNRVRLRFPCGGAEAPLFWCTGIRIITSFVARLRPILSGIRW